MAHRLVRAHDGWQPRHTELRRIAPQLPVGGVTSGCRRQHDAVLSGDEAGFQGRETRKA
jgi:hypothetical protein